VYSECLFHCFAIVGRADRSRNPAARVFLRLALLLTVSSLWAQSPVVKLTPATLSFGNELLGTTSAPQISTLSNVGNAPLTISRIITSSPLTQYNNCGSTLDPGAICTISVSFTPVVVGFVKNAVQITDNASGSPQKLLGSGTGTQLGVALSPTTLNFGVVAQGSSSVAQPVTLTNQSNATLTVNSITPNSADFIESNNCTTVTPGTSCTINVTFTPTTGGTRIGILKIADSDLSSPQALSVSGTGTSGEVSLTPSSLSFGNEKVWSITAAQTLTLRNNGSTGLGLLAIAASGDYSQSNNCPRNLTAGASCSISVKFAPLAAGARAGIITISDTDPTVMQAVNLSGTGTVATSDTSVSPRIVSLTPIQTQQFTAFINGVSSSNVSWAVSGFIGGNSQLGTITPSGLYTPSNNTGVRIIRAINKSDATQVGLARVVVTNYPGTFTFHNDTSRTGQNTSETVLTTGNVNSTQFGKLFSYPVDGLVYAQPLYVPNVPILDQGVHNVVYVATEHDSIYAYDADSGSPTPLWHVSFIASAGVTTVPSADVLVPGCETIGPEVGITGTPVIDTSTGTLYVIARTKETSGGNSSYVQRLHALDITSGAEKSGSPTVIQASVPGNGEESAGGLLSFDSLFENNRSALLLVNGAIYAGWSSLCDRHPWHGWVIGYDAQTLQQVAVFNTSPDTSESGIWQGCAGIGADALGNIYFSTGNGNFDVPGGGRNFGDTLMKMSTDSGLAVLDYFTPYNQTSLNTKDGDLGSGGVLLLPDQTIGPAHLVIAAGKEGTIYLVNRDSMGGFNSTSNSQIVQTLFGELGPIFGMPTYYRNQVYFWGNNDVLKTFSLYRGLLSENPVSRNTQISGYPGPMAAVSANGNTNGILWVIESDKWTKGLPAILHAYDAVNVSREIYNSTQAGPRDQAGAAVRFAVPTVANGKVYVGTATELDVYGLFSN
jgi:Abnormal spindle-like microcephaly-assoc'd, ASPM-SPD-2-Hydin